MSIQASQWAWQVKLSHGPKLVLLAIASFADTNGIAWPSCERLEEMTGLSARSVKRARAALIDRGLVVPQGGARSQKVRLSLEQISLEQTAPASEEPCSPASAKTARKMDKMSSFPSANLSSASAKNDTESDKMAPPSEPSIEQSKNRQSNPLTPFELNSAQEKLRQEKQAQEFLQVPDWLPMQAWNGWLEMRGRKGLPNTQRSIALTLRRLAEWHGEGRDLQEILDMATEGGWSRLYLPTASRTTGQAAKGKRAGRPARRLSLAELDAAAAAQGETVPESLTLENVA